MARVSEIKKRLAERVNRVRQTVIEGAVAQGCDRAEATEALSHMESDRPLLDWLLMGGGLEKIISLLVLLLSRTTTTTPIHPDTPTQEG